MKNNDTDGAHPEPINVMKTAAFVKPQTKTLKYCTFHIPNNNLFLRIDVRYLSTYLYSLILFFTVCLCNCKYCINDYTLYYTKKHLSVYPYIIDSMPPAVAPANRSGTYRRSNYTTGISCRRGLAILVRLHRCNQLSYVRLYWSEPGARFARHWLYAQLTGQSAQTIDYAISTGFHFVLFPVPIHISRTV